MSTYIVTFLDTSPKYKYVDLRTSRDFPKLDDALKFFESLDSSRRLALERKYTVVQQIFPEIVIPSFKLGFNDGIKNNIKKTEDEVAEILGFKDPDFWAYCEGYAKEKYKH